MKIHIVQQGDTLWNLAQKYDVDFDELLKVNGHLANPDLLMPGMKIKIPTTAVPAKKEATKGKSAPAKKAPKKEVKELPKKEAPKVELAKEEAPTDTDVSKLKELLKKAAPHVVKKLLHENKPEVIQQIQIEIINQHQETQVKLGHMPQPMPKAEPYVPPKTLTKPEPYVPPKPMPKQKPSVQPKAVQPCPPPPVWQGMSMGHPHFCSCPSCSSQQHWLIRCHLCLRLEVGLPVSTGVKERILTTVKGRACL